MAVPSIPADLTDTLAVANMVAPTSAFAAPLPEASWAFGPALPPLPEASWAFGPPEEPW